MFIYYSIYSLIIFITLFQNIFLSSFNHDFILLVQSSFVDLCNIFTKSNRLLSTIWIFVIFTKNCCDFSVKVYSSVSDKKNLQRIFNSYSTLKSFIKHQKLNQVEKLPWFQATSTFIRFTPFIHYLEFILGHVTV